MYRFCIALRCLCLLRASDLEPELRCFSFVILSKFKLFYYNCVRFQTKFSKFNYIFLRISTLFIDGLGTNIQVKLKYLSKLFISQR